MTADAVPNVGLYTVLLVLPVAALLARRVPVGRVITMLLAWVAIFAAGVFLVTQRALIDPYWRRAAAMLQLDDQQVVGKEVQIRMAADGHFWARATIDGVTRQMLIDSGATVTAISSNTAAAAGLDVHRPALPMILRTANGTISARTASIGDLKLGDIVAHDLPVVVSPAFGDTDVLGMNFLSQLKSWRVEGRTLILTPHHPQSFT
jgi:aspartyl protease family protein